MRKLIVNEFITLDGVIQAPGESEEGFAFGGWFWPHVDATLSNLMQEQRAKPLDVLLGRKTFAMWAPFWPEHDDMWPAVNVATKYVASNSMTSSDWQPSVFLSGDIAEKITRIKEMDGPDLQVFGSADLVQTLLKENLVDTLFLTFVPITLGSGKRLFGDGTIPATFTVTRSIVTSTGALVVEYERAGPVVVGSR